MGPPADSWQVDRVRGAEDIHGHRIEKNARLKLEITDALGQAPTYPVLVQLAMGGPQHGQVILDPDNNRIACDVAAFIWHDRDDQGNLIAANEEFEIGMGTLSSYVGVAPDPVTPGQVVPVWGTAELLNLAAQAKVQIDGAWADPLLLAYNVHPEPGKPDHFLCTDRQGQACPDVFEYWTGYQLDVTSQPPSSLPRVLLNAYFLGDRYGNVVYGPTATSATSPGAGVTVGFADQTSGTTSGNPAGYALTTTWPMSPAPSGQLTSTLAATYPDDPAGDWGGGTVNKAITYQFDTGSTHLLLQAQQYEKRLADQGLAVVDGPLPIAVAPGATGGLATLTDGSTPRLVLLALSGSDVTSLVTGWGEEPSSVPGWGWNTGGGCAQPWCWVQWSPPWDLVVETQATASLRLTLEDGTGRVASEGSFVVHTCPRAEHETDGPPPAQGCTDLAIPSVNGTVEVTLNQPGSARGYLGIELTQAPVAPGTYVVWVESLDQAYRVRESAQLVGRSAADEYQGGYAICTVMGGEILDENFQRVGVLRVDQPTQAYVRLVDSSTQAGSQTVNVSTYDSDGQVLSDAVAVPVSRLGPSAVFMGPLVFTPRGYSEPAHPAGLAARAQASQQGPTVLAESIQTVAKGFRTFGDWILDQLLQVRPTLAIEWLDDSEPPVRTDSQVTRIVKVDDPAQIGHKLYAEETVLRVVAKNKLGDKVTGARGKVRLDERPNVAFPGPPGTATFFDSTTDWQFSYQGDCQGKATNLRPDRGDAPDNFTSLALNEGQTVAIRLRSLAGPRELAANLAQNPDGDFTKDVFERSWTANLLLCESSPDTPCAQAPETNFRTGEGTVSQWVDQQIYSRHAAGGDFNRTSPVSGQPSNGMRDWLEAMAWDALSDFAGSTDPVISSVAASVATIGEDPGTPTDLRFAETPPAEPTTTWFIKELSEDAFRWDGALAGYQFGFLFQDQNCVKQIAMHEARHAWQHNLTKGANLVTQDGSDLDGIPASPETFDLLALRLKDDHNVAIGGGNPEAHFAGPNIDDTREYGGSTQYSLQMERDANCFEGRVVATDPTTCPSLQPALNGISGEPPSGTVTIGVNSAADLTFEVTGENGSTEDAENQHVRGTGHHRNGPMQGVLVVFSITQKPDGAQFTCQAENTPSGHASLDSCVAVTNVWGLATIHFTPGTAGHYTITVTQRQLKPEGNGQGAIQSQFPISVEVTP